MMKIGTAISLSALLILVLLLSLLPLGGVELASAHPEKLAWSIVDTPAPGQATKNIIVSPSEINAIAIGSDGGTFYAVDIPGDLPGGTYPDGKVYKSTDGGVTWGDELTRYLVANGANLPAWNIIVAPNDKNFVVAITDGNGAPNGPKEVFISQDGGANWENPSAGLVIGAGEYISCVDISTAYSGGEHDISIGTRTGGGTGKVYVLKVQSWATGWVDQGLTPVGDVVAVKFSPTYTSDSTIVVIYSDAPAAIGGTFLITGARDLVANTTVWSATQIEIKPSTSAVGTSPDCTQIITTDLELPSNFSGTDPSKCRYYISDDDAGATGIDGVYRIDDTQIYSITPPTAGRISSIAYYGTYDGGRLLAGEVTVAASSAAVNIWRCSDPDENTPDWQKAHEYKSPTGGGNSGYANAQLAWSYNGDRAYCGTNSADFSAGGTSMAIPGTWPLALLTSVDLDESAFSTSPYTPYYGQLLDIASKSEDDDIGNIWNQFSLIDTEISLLSDVAAVEVPDDSEDYDVLYLASVNDNAGVVDNFDSVWRSAGDPPGRTWERILCTATSNNGIIIRVNPRIPEDKDEDRSQVVVFADLGTNDIRHSANEGQDWQLFSLGVSVTDLTLASDEVMHILDDVFVYQGTGVGTVWTWKAAVLTELDSGHTITTPLKNPEAEDDEDEDWVIVGDAGQGRVAYADFSQVYPKFKTITAVSVPGNMHVVTDDKFEQSKTIYAGSDDGTSGKIYRWLIGESTYWEELDPPNSAFYGLAQRNGVLYGVWDRAVAPGVTTSTGVDRTLYPRDTVPPALEWDDLTAGLPVAGDANFPVSFTREPSSLKISNNAANNLWAVDDCRTTDPTFNYNWANKIGCLWAYSDTMAKVGPWTTSPASGDFISVDTVTGRATEVNFRWRQLSDAHAYELQLAKDDEFTLMLIKDSPFSMIAAIGDIVPDDPLDPAWILPSGILEVEHMYYWRVRASRGVTGEIIHSPWSATMFFTVEAGLPTSVKYDALALLNPVNGSSDVSLKPSFSWSPMPGSTKYEFILAEDAALTQVVAEAVVSTTAYEHEGELDNGVAYFWQVRAIEPVVSDPSPIANFTVVDKEEPEIIAPTSPSSIPFWIWPVIAIYAALAIAVVALVVVRPRYVRSQTMADSGLNPIIDRPKKPIDRIKNAITMKMRRRRYLSKPADDGTKVTMASKVSHIFYKAKHSVIRLTNDVSMEIKRRRYLRRLPGDNVSTKDTITAKTGYILDITKGTFVRIKTAVTKKIRGGGSSESQE